MLNNEDATFRKTLSPLAARACKIVSQIRTQENQEIWTMGLEERILHDCKEPFYPGVMFHRAKDFMERTKLWKIVEKMPKGSLLHAHMDAMFDLDFLIDQGLATPGIQISAKEAILTPTDFDHVPITFRFSTQNMPSHNEAQEVPPHLWRSGYTPTSWIPIQEAAESFPNTGEAGFRKWLKSRCSIMPEHSYYHHHGVDAIWTVFANTFPIINSLVMYEPIFRSCFHRLLGELAVDGIRYLELRITFLFQFRKEGKDVPEDDYTEFFRIVEEEIERFKATEEGKNFYGARIIWTTLRRLGNQEMVRSMKQCIAAKQGFPDLICGFDLVGQEDLGRPLVDMIPLLFWFRKQCTEAEVDIPFFFHAGECLGDGDSTDHNLFDAILLGTRRIGHGFSLFKHPLLIELIKEKKIMVECCPISNEILRLTSSIKSHPLPALLANGVPVSLCNDDPAILGHGKNGLTHDFWQVLQGLQNVDLAGLAMMVQNSIRWSCYEDQSGAEWKHEVEEGILGEGLKACRLREWHTEFEKFCEWIVLEFAEFDEED